MPVSHMGVTVSHLPSSCSFFLAALQPLGYRYIGQQGSQVGLGIHDADFFLCQETPSAKAGAAHIAFTAASRAAVRDFYAAALTAGGRSNGAPSCRNEETGHFNAAVFDLDGNSIEVVYKNGPDLRDDGSVVHHSRVITWSRTVTESYHDHSNTSPPASKAATEVSTASKPASIARSVSEPVAVAQAPAAATTTPSTCSHSGDGAAKQLIGTLLGAAAGAAVAYAFVKSEQDSAKKEANFKAMKQAKSMVSQLAPQQPQLQAPPSVDAQSIHRNNGDTASQYSPSQSGQQRAIEPAPSDYHDASYSLAPPKSEAPRSEYAPAYSVAPSKTHVTSARSKAASEFGGPQAVEYRSAAPSQAPSSASHRSRSNQDKSIEYVPAASIAPSSASHRSKANQGKSIEYIPAASVAPSSASHRSRSNAGVEYIPASSAAPSVSSVSSHRSRTSSEYQRPKAIEYAPASSIAGPRSHFSTHRSNTSPDLGDKARSTVSKAYSPAPSTLISSFVPDTIERRHTTDDKSHVSRRSSHSKHSRAPSPPPSNVGSKIGSKAASFIGSVLGRDKSHNDSSSSSSSSDIDDFEIDFNDTDTVAPSDSISQIGGSRHHHRRRRSSHHGSSADSSVSKHSSSSKHSKSSRSHHHSSRKHHPSLPSIVSEPSDASTVKPKKHSSSSSNAGSKAPSTSRKDSVTHPSEYDGKVSYGTGNVLTAAAGKEIPIRGITQSMVDGVEEKHKAQGMKRSMMSYALGQKIRAFEGN